MAIATARSSSTLAMIHRNVRWISTQSKCWLSGNCECCSAYVLHPRITLASCHLKNVPLRLSFGSSSCAFPRSQLFQKASFVPEFSIRTYIRKYVQIYECLDSRNGTIHFRPTLYCMIAQGNLLFDCTVRCDLSSGNNARELVF